MSYDEYWYGNVWLCEYYREAHKEKLKEQNSMNWLQGLYFYNAVLSAFGNAFGNEKAYLEKPIDIFDEVDPKEKEEEIKKKAEKEALTTKLYLDFMFKNFKQSQTEG